MTCESCAALQRELDAERARADKMKAERDLLRQCFDLEVDVRKEAESRAATAERELAAVREYARNQASLPYFIPGGRDAGEHWQEALREIAAPTQPASVATDGGKEKGR